jgi:hypothetical protein
MHTTTKPIVALQLSIIIFLAGSYFVTLAAVRDPSDYLPDRIARSDRRGMMYGYVFLPWEDLMMSGVEDQYMDLVAQCLDFCYVHAQWSVCSVDNDTLNENYLGNLTAFIAGLGARGVKVVVHEWVSSYSPAWMLPFTPELAGQGDRWQGIDPATANTTALIHRNALKWSMVHFHQQLCQYFRDHGVEDDIMGYCLDDETQSENWNDFFAALTDATHASNATWETMVMFNRIDKYHVTKDAGMDVHAMDPYDQDPTFVQKITYAYEQSGVDKISVLIDAMGGHEDAAFHAKMRRQAWIAWFMGADSIGWYTFLYGSDQWACARSRWIDDLGPGITPKTIAANETAIDIRLLNQAHAKVTSTSNASAMAILQQAYTLAKQNEFTSARELVQGVINA